jgi:hypothetical protein
MVKTETNQMNVEFHETTVESSDKAKAYFAKFNDNVRPFRWNSDTDGDLLDMVVDGDSATDRRDWILENYEEESMVVQIQNIVTMFPMRISSRKNLLIIPMLATFEVCPAQLTG